MLSAENPMCVLVGTLASPLEPVRKSWTFCVEVCCVRKKKDYCGVDECRACLSQSERAGLLCGVRDCGAVIDETV